jgi:quinol monooxygenase YgiN
VWRQFEAATTSILIAEAVDRHERCHGARLEGWMTSSVAFATKLGMACGTAVTAFILGTIRPGSRPSKRSLRSVGPSITPRLQACFRWELVCVGIAGLTAARSLADARVEFMEMDRRSAAALVLAGLATAAAGPPGEVDGRFGQINLLSARSGKAVALRNELAAIIAVLPTVERYEVLSDPAHPDAVWTVELWRSKEDHDQAVAKPEIQRGIARCRVLVAHFENIATFCLPSETRS